MDMQSNAFVMNKNGIQVFFTEYEHINMGYRAERHLVGTGVNQPPFTEVLVFP